eukprot:1761061-Rhodomonas_salina.2
MRPPHASQGQCQCTQDAVDPGSMASDDTCAGSPRERLLRPLALTSSAPTDVGSGRTEWSFAASLPPLPPSSPLPALPPSFCANPPPPAPLSGLPLRQLCSCEQPHFTVI